MSKVPGFFRSEHCSAMYLVVRVDEKLSGRSRASPLSTAVAVARPTLLPCRLWFGEVETSLNRR